MTLRVLAFGDSLTAGYHQLGFRFEPYAKHLSELLTKKMGQPVQVEELGFSGWTTSDMLNHFQRDDASASDVCGIHKPGLLFSLRNAQQQERPFTHVIILGGTNDLGSYSGENTLSNLKELHNAISSKFKTRTIALTIPEHFSERHMTKVASNRKIVNDGLKQLAAQRIISQVVDIAELLPFFSLSTEEQKLLWEGLHLTAAGYHRIAELVYQNITWTD